MSKIMEEMCNLAMREAREDMAKKMLSDGKLSVEKVAEYSRLSVEEVKNLERMVHK